MHRKLIGFYRIYLKVIFINDLQWDDYVKKLHWKNTIIKLE